MATQYLLVNSVRLDEAKTKNNTQLHNVGTAYACAQNTWALMPPTGAIAHLSAVSIMLLASLWLTMHVNQRTKANSQADWPLGFALCGKRRAAKAVRTSFCLGVSLLCMQDGSTYYCCHCSDKSCIYAHRGRIQNQNMHPPFFCTMQHGYVTCKVNNVVTECRMENTVTWRHTGCHNEGIVVIMHAAIDKALVSIGRAS